MYKILTKLGLLVFTGMQISVAICGQFVNLPQSTCPNRSNIKYLHQTHQNTSGMYYKRYSLYACTYVASVRDISTIVCYGQVLFVEVTKLKQLIV